MVQLMAYPLQNKGVGVACARDTEAPGQIDEAIAVGVPDIGSERALPNDWVLPRSTALGSPSPSRSDRRAFVGRQKINPRLPFRARHGATKFGQSGAVLGARRRIK